MVIPTFNERGNLGELIKRITAALEGIRWEVIVVDDDSPDGTAAEARAMYGGDARVRCIRRLVAVVCLPRALRACSPAAQGFSR